MSKIGLLFPGQGSQYVGMGKELYNKIPEAKKIMDNANDILGYDIKSIIFNGTEEELTNTKIAQPAIFIVSAMYFEKFKQMSETFQIVAGHSLGEYSALYAAGVLDFEGCLELVQKRGQAMSLANTDGVMFAVMGVEIKEINKHVEQSNQKTVVANINSKTQVVISGLAKETGEIADKLAQLEGAKVKKLNVSNAFHSPLMIDAQKIMEEEIKTATFKEPAVSIIPNILGFAVTDVRTIRDALIQQITGQVKWLDTILYMKNNEVSKLYEIGPGEVLKKINRTITFRPKCSTL